MGDPREPAQARADGSTAEGGAKRRRRRRPRRPATPASEAAAGSGAKRIGGSGRDDAAGTTRTTEKAKAATPTRKKGQAKGHRKGGGKKRRKRRGASASRNARAATTKREISAGGVVYRREGDDIEVVLASRRTRRGELAWGLAKGGIEENESPEDAAVREVREETGLLAEIEASLGETRYFYVWEDVRIRKTVHFFLMRHAGGNVEDRDDEMEEIRWFPLERALKRAAYRGERDVLGRAAAMLR
jgi:8-oxo-dGTP pyrophosphatase MutT (NUDIX family)